MPILQLNLDPSRKELRWFAGLWWPAMCAAIGLMLYRKLDFPNAAAGLWAVGVLLGVAGLVAPSIIRPLYVGLIRLTYPIGYCVSHVVLAALYFLILTPIGFLVRRFHDPMQRKFDCEASSYWVAREAVESASYFRQS